MEQSKMDLAYKDFLERQGFAGDALEEYKSSLYKYPYQAYQKQTQGFSKPSSFQNLMGIVSAGAKVAPFLGFKEGGHIAFRSQGGLSGLTANYEDGTGASTVGSGTSYKQGLMDSLKNMMNLSSMSSDLTRLQELRTKIAESKAQKEIGKNTLLNAIGEFAQGVASSYDPTKPQTMAGSLAAGAGAVQERQDPDIIKAQTEAEALESGIKTKQAMAELTKDYIKAASDLGTDFEVADSNDLRKDVALKFGYKLNENKEIVKEDGTPLTQQASDKVFNMYKKALDKYLAFGGGAKGKQKAVEFIAGQSSLLTGLDGDNKGSSLDDKETQDYINKVEKEIDYK